MSYGDPEEFSWMEYLGFLLVFVIAAILVLVTQGCATCQPECCDQCPVKIEVVEAPPEIITVLPPEVRVPATPVLESIEQTGLAQVDPASWLRLLAQDVLELMEAFEAAQTELEAVNASREP